MARFGFGDQFIVDSKGGGRGGFQFKSKINTTLPSILMIEKWRLGLAATEFILDSGGGLILFFLFHSGQGFSVASVFRL